MAKTETIVLGSGCFWCAEAAFEMLKGVVNTTVGYAGGTLPNPTYDSVQVGDTGYIEVLKLEYDPDVLSLDMVFQVYFHIHDPTSMDRQGADFGPEYHSIIFYTTKEQKDAAENYIKRIQKDYDRPIVTEVKKLDKFNKAEEYHQHYFDKNPLAGYCMVVIRPKVHSVKKNFPHLLK